MVYEVLKQQFYLTYYVYSNNKMLSTVSHTGDI